MENPRVIEVKQETFGTACVMTPMGDIDLSAAPDLRVALREGIEKSGSRAVVDLANVDYMDSSGVATLVDAMRTAKQLKIHFVICGMGPRVRSIFEIARLDSVFTIMETRDEALAGDHG